ncbi:TPA: hypothetical protein P5R10_002186 [Legionella pneumophila]|nr:hypothetical protein [Legionella pneumophila]HDO7964995.1 hypothetical protein [Legionella pneumophila]HDO7999156.1 hypothetical protein [Legionella pneumophila]HDO8346758.1 hypothetical protein [Legionella pneumophila]HDO9891982.1 hypothetical protein [Legionella pneumophila]
MKFTMEWYCDFKLHLTSNDKNELMIFKIKSSRTDGRLAFPYLSKNLFGKIICDKSYISQNLTDNCLNESYNSLLQSEKFDKALLGC